jgi:hypothetical protein
LHPILCQQQLREFKRIFYADTAGTEGAGFAIKQILAGGVVQVNQMFV